MNERPPTLLWWVIDISRWHRQFEWLWHYLWALGSYQFIWLWRKRLTYQNTHLHQTNEFAVVKCKTSFTKSTPLHRPSFRKFFHFMLRYPWLFVVDIILRHWTWSSSSILNFWNTVCSEILVLLMCQKIFIFWELYHMLKPVSSCYKMLMGILLQ